MWQQWHGGGPCLIHETVFAAGFDDKYVVAENHPDEDRNRTAYWYIIRDLKNEDKPLGIPYTGIMGPFGEKQYFELKARLHLPDFSIVYDDLK